MKMEIICLRHGESIGNVACHKSYVENDHSHFTPEFKKIPSCDWPLTKDGISHSKSASRYIKEKFLPIDSYFSSDYPRARETSILLDLSNNWIYTEMLRERNRGLMDGLSKQQWLDLSSKEKISFNEDSIDWKPPMGESAREMISRLNKLFNLIKSKNAKKILLVTHGELIQCMRFMIRNISNKKYKNWIDKRGDVKNCQIFQFIFDSRGAQEISHYLNGKNYVEVNNGYFNNT